MNLLKIVVAWSFFLSLAAYLLFLFLFIKKMRMEQGAYWAHLGNPSSFDPNGQIKVLGIIFLRDRIPSDILANCRALVFAIRLFAVTALVFFGAISIMVATGMYD